LAKQNKLPSATTPNSFLPVRQWLAELVMYRKHKGRLPEAFWKVQKFKWQFVNELKAVSTFIKRYGEDVVKFVVVANKDIQTFTSYGDVEVKLQKAVERLNRIMSPKDDSPATFKPPIADGDFRHRENNVSPRQSLFLKLNEMEKLDG